MSCFWFLSFIFRVGLDWFCFFKKYVKHKNENNAMFFNAEEELESIWKFCLMSQEYAYSS